MAYTNPLLVANGLELAFTIDAANTGSDSFLGVNTSTGSVTKFASVPASRVSSGGNLTEATSSVLTINASGVLLGNATIQVKLAGAGQSGYLSSTDWNTFNNKLSTSLTSAYVFVGNGSNVATGVAITGDISISNAGVVAIATGVIVNADINNSAAIAVSKLAAMSTNLVVATDGSGFVTTVAGFTTTIAGYLTTITSNVQTQLNTKIVAKGTNAIVQSPTAVQNGYAIIWDNGAAEWTLGPTGSGGSVTGPGSSTNTALVRWNGTGGTSLSDSSILLDGSGNLTAVNSITINTSGLHLLDTDASHDLIITVGSNLTADRTLTITTGDAGRTLTISGDATINDWFDQSVKAAASPSFADVTLSNAGGLHILDSDSSNDLIITTSSNLTADRTLTLVPGDVARTLTINASGTIYVTGGTDVALADGGTGASLSDPGANSLWGWDDTDNAIKFITIGSGLSYDHATYTLTSSGGGWAVTGTTTLTGAVTIDQDAHDISFINANISIENILTVGVARFWSTANSSAYDDLFIGTNAGNTSISGSYSGNIGIGHNALAAFSSSGGSNVAVGHDSMVNLSSGAQLNVALGVLSLSTATTAEQNTAIGHQSLLVCTDGISNSALGVESLSGVTTGDFNIGIGDSGGINITTGSYNIAIGYRSWVPSATLDGQLNIQNAIYGSSNTGTDNTVSSGIVGLYTTQSAGSWQKALFIGNMGAQGTAISNGVVVYSKDSSDGSANATLALYLEQAVESIGTFTPSHKIKVWINGTEYWLQLDAV